MMNQILLYQIYTKNTKSPVQKVMTEVIIYFMEWMLLSKKIVYANSYLHPREAPWVEKIYCH